MSSESEGSNLPFEPKNKRQKPAKAKNQPVVKAKVSQKLEKPPFTKEEMAIPEVVSKRMIRRVAAFCGIPTALGLLTLVGSYLLITLAKVQLPPIAVLLVNMGLFGIGVIGITYGVLSASWDEDRVGGLFGFSEFTTNWGRMVDTWRETRQKKA